MPTAAGQSLSQPRRAVRPCESPGSPQSTYWQDELRAAFRDPAELLAHLGLPAEPALEASKGFGCLAPRPYVARIRNGDRFDPLLLQVLPDAREGVAAPGFVSDPLREASALTGPGTLQKYFGRVLWMIASGCAIHCRYCFRREYPYGESDAGLGSLESVASAISADPSLSEVILSGGDPLLVSDHRLREAIEALAAIGHVQRVRIHTRLPVVIPNRVTQQLVETLRSTRLTVVVVIHTNHAREFDSDVQHAMSRLRRSDALLLNQSVLLRGINDSVEALADLSESLIDSGVAPYYLHLLDRVRGTAHFETRRNAVGLIKGLRDRLPGYAVPRLVRESPAETSKSVIA